MLACTSAPSLKSEQTSIENKKIEFQLEQGLWLLSNFYLYLYVHVLGLRKSTMAAQITPSYIFADI